MKNRKIVLNRFLLTMAMTALLGACQSVPSARSTGELANKIDTTLDEAAHAAAGGVPADVSKALLPPLEISLPEGRKAPIDTRFSFTVSNAPARQVFMNLVESTKYSVIVAPGVRGRVSLNLRDVTVPEAMSSIRRVYGYGFRREGDRFYITGAGMQTRLFPVNYLSFVRKGKSDTRVSSGELTRSGSSSSGSSSSSSSSQSTGSAASIQVETRSKSEFWKDLKETLEAIVGDKGGRRVVVNPPTNLVIVRAMPQELRVVENFLGITHDTVNRQVILEAKILEVELQGSFQMGVNWAALASVGGGTITAGQVGGGTIFSGDGVAGTVGNTGVLNPASPTAISGTDVSAFGGMFSLAIQSSNFTAFLEALETQGEVQVLSSPRVSTINNQKAVIKVGGDEFFVTGVTQNVVSSGTTTTTVPEIELTPFFSGIALDVTPQIDDSGNIILHIHPVVSNVAQKTKSFMIASDTYTLPLAISTIQESDSVVRAKSGQIIIIGGLMKEGTTDDNASIPMLGRIPLIGNMFKHKKLVRIKKELVILLKPTVVQVGQSWADMINKSKSRINSMQKDF